MATTQINKFAMPGIEVLAGRASKIREWMKGTDHAHFVTFKLKSDNEETELALVQAVKGIMPLIAGKLEERQRLWLEHFLDALVPPVSIPEHLITEARMNAEARTAVLESADWLTAAQLSEIAGFSGRNYSAQPNKWKREGKIFAIQRNGSDYYPGYALDPDLGYRPISALTHILKIFEEKLGAWDIAIWFASVNSFLNGQAPKDLLASEPERVLAAAEDEMMGVQHG